MLYILISFAIQLGSLDMSQLRILDGSRKPFHGRRSIKHESSHLTDRVVITRIPNAVHLITSDTIFVGDNLIKASTPSSVEVKARRFKPLQPV